MSGQGGFRLINARPSPYGRRVAIVLIEKGLDYEVTYDVPWGSDTCTPEHSPFQQLPILISPDGEGLYESSYILEWLEAKYPEPPLLPAGPRPRRGLLGAHVLHHLPAPVRARRAHRLAPHLHAVARGLPGGVRRALHLPRGRADQKT